MARKWNLGSLPDKILVNNTFYLSPKEIDRVDEFKNSHDRAVSCFSYTFEQSSGIGMNVSIKCLACNAELDITDFDYW